MTWLTFSLMVSSSPLSSRCLASTCLLTASLASFRLSRCSSWPSCSRRTSNSSRRLSSSSWCLSRLCSHRSRHNFTERTVSTCIIISYSCIVIFEGDGEGWGRKSEFLVLPSESESTGHGHSLVFPPDPWWSLTLGDGGIGQCSIPASQSGRGEWGGGGEMRGRREMHQIKTQ